MERGYRGSVSRGSDLTWSDQVREAGCFSSSNSAFAFYRCRALKPSESPTSPPESRLAGFDLENARHQPNEKKLSPKTVGGLEVKWVTELGRVLVGKDEVVDLVAHGDHVTTSARPFGAVHRSVGRPQDSGGGTSSGDPSVGRPHVSGGESPQKDVRKGHPLGGDGS